MRILAVGDPHGDIGKIRRVPAKDADLILVTGDLGSASLMRKIAFENIAREKKGLPEKEYTPKQQKRAFMEAYDSSIRVIRHLARYAPVFLIYGNVESTNAETKKRSKEIGLPLPFLTDELKSMDRVSIVNNRLRNFDGIRIGSLGYFVDTNWVRDFKPSEYKKRLSAAKKQTDKARRVLKNFGKVDILMHHQPPYGILDKVGNKAPEAWRGKNAGSKVILDYIKRRQPKYAFCGHIHEGEGRKKVGRTEVYNLGVCDYKMVEF